MSKKEKNPLKNKTVPPNANPWTCAAVHALRKSDHYRTALENLLGVSVVLEGEYSSCKEQTISDFGDATFICLQNLRVKKAPSSMGHADKQSVIDHMWLVCDEDYAERNGFVPGDRLQIHGTLYEYARNGVRNIGLILDKAKFVARKKDMEKAPKKTKVVKLTELETIALIEKLIESRGVFELCDLSMLVREQFPDWYKVVVKNSDYFNQFMESLYRKSHSDPTELLMKRLTGEKPEEEPKKLPTSLVSVENATYDLSNTVDYVGYRTKLANIVSDFANDLTCKHPKKQIFVVADCKKLISVQSSSKQPMPSKHISSCGEDYKFIDICSWEGERFVFRHYNAQQGVSYVKDTV